jgi:hypothetical protein
MEISEYKVYKMALTPVALYALFDKKWMKDMKRI